MHKKNPLEKLKNIEIKNSSILENYKNINKKYNKIIQNFESGLSLKGTCDVCKKIDRGEKEKN